MTLRTSKTCEICATKCCTSEPVFLTQYDIEKISKVTGFSVKDIYLTREQNSKLIKLMRFKNGACMFFDQGTGRCRIYESRPLDCQLFPLDIDFQNGEYRWIFYNHCDLKNMHMQAALQSAKAEILPVLREDLKEYAELRIQLYYEKRWVPVEKIPL